MAKNTLSAYVCLGANLGDCKKNLARARASINVIGPLVRESRIYFSRPREYLNQPWFYNQVIQVELERSWTAPAYLAELLKIETSLGRTRDGARYGPRVIDADLLWFDGINGAWPAAGDAPACVIPHPRLRERAFALAPLREIAPDVQIYGKTASEWLRELNWRLEGDKIWQT